jgi:hypothetical protein
MRCNEYRELLFERMAGELNAEQELNCAAHETECLVCRAELAEFRDVSAKLRAGWPSEDPAPLAAVVPAHPASRKWFDAALDVAGVWFARASSLAVAACLVALVVLRPAVHVDRGGLQVAFGTAQAPAAVAVARNEQELRAMVQAAVSEQMQRVQPVVAPAPQRHVGDAGVTQVAMQVRELRDSEAKLWQAVQQHNVYLETLWRNTAELRPASLTQ